MGGLRRWEIMMIPGFSISSRSAGIKSIFPDFDCSRKEINIFVEKR